jgi:ubiquinone/menaquinone biosynthesis C-methylase UbiE
MANISFDRAADYYDTTRGYAEGSAERIRDAIVAYAGAGKDSRFLELGVGTGRIALPFIRGGYDYTGVDISRAMMDRLAAKIAADPGAAGYRYDLREADVAALPFADGAFDVAITVHVLHLVADWQAVVREARRVLRANGGLLLIGNDNDTSWDNPATATPPARVRDHWLQLRKELGFGRHANVDGVWGQDERLIAYLRSLGATTEIVELTTYERPALSAREMVERYRARMYSGDWHTPEDVHAEASRRLEAWMADEIADPDQPYVAQGQFTAVAARWDGNEQRATSNE